MMMLVMMGMMMVMPMMMIWNGWELLQWAGFDYKRVQTRGQTPRLH